MEHLALEVFDLATKENPRPTGSQYAVLEPDETITITDTSEIFANGDVWSYDFTLNVHANAHIFGTAGDIHGSRLHEQINKRKARLWVVGVPLYLGYLKLGDEAEVDAGGNVDVSFESGQKTFEEMIEGTSATEVSVGDVVIGVALNRKRTVVATSPRYIFKLDGLAAYAEKDHRLDPVMKPSFDFAVAGPGELCETAYTQRWPKMVKSHGLIYDSNLEVDSHDDYTNVQTPYDDTPAHSFCNINICYPLKALKTDGEEIVGRGYTVRLAHGNPTTHGGDDETRYNNSPNFYLLYFIDRLFKDLGIHITENQAKDVEDLRRVFMLNYGCHYEEIENDGDYFDSTSHKTPADSEDKPYLSRYGQYYIPFLDNDGKKYLINKWDSACLKMEPDNKSGTVSAGKILLRDIKITVNGEDIPVGSSAECKVEKTTSLMTLSESGPFEPELSRCIEEQENAVYSAYLAYATGDNYPHVEISEVVNAMKSMFGVRLLFSNDYSTVRIVLLRNVFRSKEVQDIACDIEDKDEKVENKIRGFRMTYGKGTDDSSFYYKGFADLFQRAAKTWKDTSDRHDYSQWKLDADYDYIKQYVSAMNKICYVTPVNGNAYGVKVDEDEEVLFPSLFEYAGFMDAEDGDCSAPESEGKTIEEIQCGATPVLMNETGVVFASLFNGDMKAPTPTNTDDTTGTEGQGGEQFNNVSTTVATFARTTNGGSQVFRRYGADGSVAFSVEGLIDAYSCEGYHIRMEDNYAVSNGGTPFDEADPGLCFGIMRGSGNDAFVHYYEDTDDDENEAWDIVQGSGAVSHPDTCDSYGKLWDYNGNEIRIVATTHDAIVRMQELWPDSNINLVYSSGTTYRDISTWISSSYMVYVQDDNGNFVMLMLAAYLGSNLQTNLFEKDGVIVSVYDYMKRFSHKSVADMYEADRQSNGGLGVLIEVGSSYERWETLKQLQQKAFVWSLIPLMNRKIIEIDENGVGATYGRFSLKLRAEKLNPYYDQRQLDAVRKKQEAAVAMTKLYTTSNTDLLSRQKVSNAAMRSAGWDCPGDGYATVYSMEYEVMYSDGATHKVLWTPIKQDGTVKTPAQLMEYVADINDQAFNALENLDVVNMILKDEDLLRHDTEHLILDIDTTEERAEILHGLQAIYYADDGETVEPVDISQANPRYLRITNEDLQGRGLCDQFYKEYSYWIRNARIVKRTVRMTLAQLLTIDKTKRVRVGDVTGFIRKIQYTVSNETGLGNVVMEIMYI